MADILNVLEKTDDGELLITVQYGLKDTTLHKTFTLHIAPQKNFGFSPITYFIRLLGP
uniref:Uncharacterized protein n=1 Tax=Anguilla anguilla TaxID=7936 RepID=A0A0E9WES0_ANGAN